MLADNCESTVRARKPSQKGEIAEIVQSIFDNRIRSGQLDEADLTLRDVTTARDIFIDMLQAVFHPRINYPLVSPSVRREPPELVPEALPSRTDGAARVDGVDGQQPERATPEGARRQVVETPPAVPEQEDDKPLLEVPPLRRTQKLPPVEKPDTPALEADDDGV
jgi:hypothetical protein